MQKGQTRAPGILARTRHGAAQGHCLRPGRHLGWPLDARGEPYAFGAHDDDTGSISGPWNFVKDGIHHPAWVARPDGSWRASVQSLEVNAKLADADFARPAGGAQD